MDSGLWQVKAEEKTYQSHNDIGHNYIGHDYIWQVKAEEKTYQSHRTKNMMSGEKKQFKEQKEEVRCNAAGCLGISADFFLCPIP